MAKIVYACVKEAAFTDFFKRNLPILSSRLVPDNIRPRPPVLYDDRGITYAILNPNDSITADGSSVCMGTLLDRKTVWSKPLSERPDGSYALFRSDSRHVEVLSDVVGTRTIWYFMDDKVFISSTSQRAIVCLLGTFQPNEQVIPWVLSTGTLGAGNSWDRRIQCLEGDSSLILDREAWELSRNSHFQEFTACTGTDSEHRAMLEHALRDTFASLRLDWSKWVLPLSGGFDSRGILCLLKDHSTPRTITWGLRESLREARNDAYIARQLARSMGAPHQYFATDISDESVEPTLRRFIVCGEGRIDHIAGYMDGFELWRTLFLNGVHGIIRGDEGFGWSPVVSPSDVRRSIGLTLMSDFANLADVEQMGLPEQRFPEKLARRDAESLERWRDRLYHQFRIPFVLAALTDLKCPYVEIVSPLLSRRVLYQVRTMPDHLRTDKAAYKAIVRRIGPRISFAAYPAIQGSNVVLKTKRFVECIAEELSTAGARSVLPPEFLAYILKNVESIAGSSAKTTRPAADRLRSRMPRWLARQAKRFRRRQRIDFNVLAFRAYVVSKVTKMLNEDARSMD